MFYFTDDGVTVAYSHVREFRWYRGIPEELAGEFMGWALSAQGALNRRRAGRFKRRSVLLLKCDIEPHRDGSLDANKPVGYLL